jgi:hypothetical protein
MSKASKEPCWLIDHLKAFSTGHQDILNIVTWQLKAQNNGARRNCPLVGNILMNMYHSNGYAYDNGGTVGGVSSVVILS